MSELKTKIKLKQQGGSLNYRIPSLWLRAKGYPTEIFVTLGDRIIIEVP